MIKNFLRSKFACNNKEIWGFLELTHFLNILKLNQKGYSFPAKGTRNHHFFTVLKFSNILKNVVLLRFDILWFEQKYLKKHQKNIFV